MLSPCVLPLVPIVLGTALSQPGWGRQPSQRDWPVFCCDRLVRRPLRLHQLGLDSGFFRAVGAVMLFAVGMVMVVPNLSTKLAAA